MDEQLEARLRFLKKASADELPHSDRALLHHLLGTRRLLMDWGARPAVCDAGLFHSVYGTEHYEQKAVPLSMRTDVRQLIGDEAEELAWLFCVMRRESFDENVGRGQGQDLAVQDRLSDERLPLTQQQFHDLVTVTFANCLEAIPRMSWMVRRNIRRYLRPFRSIAIPAAQSALDEIEARPWQFWK